MVTSGAIICRVSSFSPPFLSTSSHFRLVWAHSSVHLYPQSFLDRPGGFCYRSKQISPFVPSVCRCSEVGPASPSPYPTLFRCSTYSPFSPPTTLERPGVILSRPEREPFVCIGRTDPLSILFVSALRCTVPLNTTLLSQPHHDAIPAYPPAGDKWSTLQSFQLCAIPL